MAKRRTEWNQANGKAGGAALREAVHFTLLRFPAITRVEVARRLGCSKTAALKHVAAIRAEWRQRYQREVRQREAGDDA